MRKHLLSLFVCVLSILALSAFSWAQCPEDPDDRGNCDTLNVTCLDCEQTPGTGPWQVRFPLLVTHDQTQPDDSIAGFVIPIGWTRTNPAAFCSLDAYWNTTDLWTMFPGFPRSIFRHMVNEADSTDTLMHNRMALMAADFTGRGWDTRLVDVSTDDAYARMSFIATGSQDQKWWEGDRILLATLTYVIEDTMTICMDTTFWPPTNTFMFSRSDAQTYVPRDNLPNCFTVGIPPDSDFTIEAAPDADTVQPGESADYTVTLTSVGGFDSPCTLTVTGLPGGATAEFAPNPVTPTNTSAMTITTTGATPEGTYPLTVTATEILPPLSPRWRDNPSEIGPVQIEHSTQVTLEVITAEAITVTAPNGGEEWCVGSSQSITWSSSGIDTVKIEYSINAGSNWITEVEKTPAAPGTYSWTVPNAPSGQCLVKICDAGDGTPCDQSNALFTIKAAPAAPSACTASDDLCDKVSFTWTDNSGDETGFIVYRGGSPLDTVAADVTTYDDATATPGQTYTYGVSAYNDCGESSQCSDDGTRKAPPSAPSDCLASDDLCDKVSFTWTDNSGDETGFIVYREGSALDTVAAGVTSYDDLTAAPGVTYNYCVSALNDCGESNQCCDNGAVVAQTVTVTAPNGGENWTVGTSQNITWSSDCLDSVKIEYSTNAGSNWITEVEAVLAGPGSYSWTVPDAPSEDCLVRICDAEDGSPCDQSNAVFTISTEVVEAVTVTAPNGGEMWCVGSAHDITWTSTDIDSVKIEYSTNAGSQWITEAERVPAASGSYSWTIPDTPSENCLVRISDAEDGDPSDQSNAVFTILGPPADPSACVASDDLCDKVQFTWTDNSGDETGFIVYREGSALDTVAAGVTSYDDLTAAPGVTYNYCVSALNDCGESSQCCDNGTRKAPPDAPSDCVASDDLCDKVNFCWTDNSEDETGFYIYRDAAKLGSVGADATCYFDFSATPGITYEYCVTAYNDCGESSQCCDNGGVVAQTLTVASPNGGENWTVGTTQSITWSFDCIDSVKIEYSTDNGSSWITEVEAVMAGPGSYSWTVPNAPSDICLVRICDAEDGGPCDQSDAVFTISTEVVEAVTVTAPNGGEVWCGGSTENITWTSTDIDAVKIEYSTDGGSSWTVEVASVPAAGGSYSWTVPDAPSTNCLVRICDAEDGDPCDQSNALFTILGPPADPSACVASDDLCDKVQFTWTDNSGNETGFYIYRDAAKLDSVGVDVVSYDDPTATPGQTYSYGVSAYNDCGESSQCNDNGTRQAPPAAPSDCVASDDLCDKVQFTWVDNSGNEDGFIVYRGGSPLDTVGAGVTLYDDPTATPGVTYSYCVSAYNDCGESNQCCDNGTVIAQAVTVTSPNGGENWTVGTGQNITWTSSCIDSVDIEYSTDGGSSWTVEAEGVLAASGSYSWTVPDAPSENCLVKICDAEDGSPCDQSDDVFTIVVADFTIEAQPDTQEVQAGSSVDFDVILTSLYGFDSPCTLTVTGLPHYASADFDPNPATPTDLSVMTITTAETDTLRTYDITITATELAGKGIQHSTQVVLIVTFQVDPDSQEVQAGECIDYDVILTPLIGVADSFDLSVSDLPPFSSGSFDPNPVAPTDTSVLTICTAPSTPEGVYVITITATAVEPGKLEVESYTIHVVLTVTPTSEFISIQLDIKPQSCPNPFNTKSNGVLPVAVLGTDQFDVGDIDPGTVMLEGVSPLRWNWKDVTGPVIDPTDTCDCTTRGGDGYTDMTFKFDRQDIVGVLETQMPFADGETRILTITGMTYAGVPIEGTDCVVILHKGQSRSSEGNIAGYSLGKNYPNPFNPETDISFTLPERIDATLTIYNVLGKAIKVLVDREMSAGTHTVHWNGRDEYGNPVSSGIYFYRLKADTFDQTMKMVLMK